MNRHPVPPLMRGQPPGCHGVARQRGSVTIMASIFVITAILLGIAFDAGYLFYMRRHLQAVADMAATAGAQALPDYDTVNSRVISSVQANKFSSESLAVGVGCGSGSGGTGTVQVVCTQWPFVPGSDPEVAPPSASSTDANAVWVQVSEAVPSFFPGVGDRTVTKTAIAKKTLSVAAFSVGSGLLRTDSSGVLAKALGLNTCVGCYSGLANIALTPAGILNQLGIPVSGNIDIGTLNAAVAAKGVTIGSLLDVIDTMVAAQSQTAAAGVSLLSDQLKTALAVSPLDIPIQLFSENGTSGIFTGITTANEDSALNANVNVLDLLNAIAGVSTSNNFVNLSLGIPGVTVKAYVISPPAVGIGGVGTTATDAQVRLYVLINTNNLPIIGSVLAGLNTGVSIPLIVEAARSTGTINVLDCSGMPNNVNVDIGVTSSVANVCIGEFQDGVTGDGFFSSNNSCESMSGNRTQIASLIGIPINSRISLNLINSAEGASANFQLDPGSLPQTQTISTNLGNVIDNSQISAILGNTSQGIVNALLAGIVGDISSNPNATIQGGTPSASSVAGWLVTAQGNKNGAITQINNYLASTGSAVQNTINSTTGTLGSLLTLNIAGVVNGVSGIVSGVVGVVNGLVGGIIGSIVSGTEDLICNALGSGAKQCRINDVSPSLSGSNLIGSVVSMVFSLLNPLLQEIGNNILNPILQLGITDVSLSSVTCSANNVQLVY